MAQHHYMVKDEIYRMLDFMIYTHINLGKDLKYPQILINSLQFLFQERGIHPHTQLVLHWHDM